MNQTRLEFFEVMKRRSVQWGVGWGG